MQVPGEMELNGKGSYSNFARGMEHFEGKRVAVVGGGDTGFESAVQVAEAGAREVLLVVRTGTPRARPHFAQPAFDHPRVSPLFNCNVTRVLGDDWVRGVELMHAGEARLEAADELHVRIGRRPSTDWLKGLVDLDRKGFANVDPSGRTNVDWVYAIGDMAAPHAPSVAWAAGSGMAAAKHLEMRLRARN